MAKATCKKLDERVTQKGGIVIIGQIKPKIQKRNNEKVIKVRIELDCAIATVHCKVQAVINANKKLCKNMFKVFISILIARKKFQLNRRNFYKVICKSMKKC